jgi:CRP-like cAMP-binding protein
MTQQNDRSGLAIARLRSAALRAPVGSLGAAAGRRRRQPVSVAPQLPPISALTRKLAARTSLSSPELGILDRLDDDTRPVAANRDIVTEGYKYDGLAVLREGIAIRYHVLRDGRRQILNVVLPGDFIGFPACFFDTALYSITALTGAVVSSIPFTRLFQLFGEYPRIGAAIFWLFSCEAAMYAERLVGIGQRSAVERLAHLLLELLTRLQVIGLADERSFRMPLTQEQIGDILGLTGVHVSRTFRQLRDDGLVSIEGQMLTIKDRNALSALADFERTYLSHFRMSEALFPDEAGRVAVTGA